VTGISDVIVESLIASLTADCQTAIATSDPTYVDTIREGKLTSDPETAHGNHVLIFHNDPRNPGDWRDEVVTISSLRVPPSP